MKGNVIYSVQYLCRDKKKGMFSKNRLAFFNYFVSEILKYFLVKKMSYTRYEADDAADSARSMISKKCARFRKERM